MIQGVYTTEVVGGDDDDTVNIAVPLRLASLSMDKLAAMHSAAACAIRKVITCPHRDFVTSGLPTQNRIQQNFGVGFPGGATYWF